MPDRAASSIPAVAAAGLRPSILLKLAFAGAAAAIAGGLYLSSLYNFVLFHTLIEVATACVAFALFSLAWHTRKYLDSGYLRLIGTGYGFAALLHLGHTLAFKGMHVFQGDTADLSIQCWIAARYLQAATVMLAPLFAARRLGFGTIIPAYALAAGILLAVLFTGNFPSCYVDGKGLTLFKVASEYIISAMYLSALFFLYHRKSRFSSLTYKALFASIVFAIFSEMSFTAYISVYGFANLLGHYFKLVEYYFVYVAILAAGLERPFDLIFRDLKQTEEALLASQNNLEQQVKNRTDELAQAYRELQQSEEKYRRIVDSANEGIQCLGPDLRVNFVNAAMTEILGYSSGELLGRPVTDFMFEEDIDDHHRMMERRRQGIAQNYERRFRHKDGHEVWTIVSGVPVFDENGECQGAIGMFTDVTARKKAENELLRHKEQLEQTVRRRTSELLVARDAADAANKAKSVFLANMSHELRTPLNAVLGFSGLMRREPDVTPSQREKLDIINRCGEHLLTLINDVLEMAKIEAGRLQLEIAPFDLGGMVRDVADMMRIKAQEKGLQLQTGQSSAFPRFIRGDEARLRQVLVNLAGNAVKFTAEGSVTIQLGTKENARQQLVIEVEDTGPGIKPEDQARLFQPFVQLARSEMQKGTGLGLAISRQFVELMGGTISLESTLGKGSIFRIDLPVELAEAAEIAACQAGGGLEDVCGLAPGQPDWRILIAEDQPENQVLLTKLMTSIGLDTRLAVTGAECVQMFQEWHPHLIWMDRCMPVMDGVEATRRIRALPGGSDIRIIAVTASAFGDQYQELRAAGMDELVGKPYRFREIYDCLRRHLGMQFLYTAAAAAEADEQVTLTPEMLAAITDAQCLRLREAITILDSDSITAAIAEAGETDAALRRALTQLAENFDYPAILKAVEVASTARRL